MSENNVAADANAAPEGSTVVDSQLAEMHAAEGVQVEASQEQKESAPDDGQAAAPEVKKVVPLAALHEERRARQDLQRQIVERDRQYAEQMQRVNQRLEMLANPQKQAPTREEDPVAYLDNQIGQVALTQRQILERDQQRDQQAAQTQYVQRLAQRVEGVEAVFINKAPDYHDAIAHLDNMRVRELQVYGATEAEARAQAVREKQSAALQWAHEGKNPAEVAYELAKARGYTPKAQQQQTPADKIAAQQRGVTAARSLGGGGSPNAGKLTAEALANMSDEDFSKLTEAQFKQAMGG